MKNISHTPRKRGRSQICAAVMGFAAATAMLLTMQPIDLSADETCNSPYMAKIVGQEDYIYVWTLGAEGVGDEQDKLVTVSVNPKSKHYGKHVHSVSVGGRNEAHHGGLSDDRRYLWVAGLDTSRIFIFDIHTNPGKPKLHKSITDFVSKSGGIVGPHTFYALPGRMMITGLSNNQDHGGRTGMVEYTNAGEYVVTHWMPTDDNLQGAVKTGQYADGYGYDVRALPRRNIMLTSSFTGWNNYMMDFGKLLNDPEAMKRFGNTMVVWDLHTRKPKKVLDVPGAPLEIRCAWGPQHNYCFTTTALTSQLWLIYEDENGEWQAKAVADIADPASVPLPVDISITSDDKGLWVDTFLDGMVRYFDISDPHHPKMIHEFQIGEMVNMVSQSWDGKRVYFTTSLLSKWDKGDPDVGQFLKAYDWDGKQLTEVFSLDFVEAKLGLPHIMRFGAYSLYGQNHETPDDTVVSELQQ